MFFTFAIILPTVAEPVECDIQESGGGAEEKSNPHENQKVIDCWSNRESNGKAQVGFAISRAKVRKNMILNYDGSFNHCCNLIV